MEYKVTLPLPPSVNHCYTRRSKYYFKNGKRKKRVMNVLTKVAAQWLASSRDACLTCMNGWECLPQKTIVELYVWWPDKRKRDVHNLHKMLADCLEGFVTPDDKWMLIRDMDFNYDKHNPRVEVVARPYDA